MIFFIPKKEALRIIAPKLFALPILSSKIACSEFFFHSEISFFETELIFGKSIIATMPWWWTLPQIFSNSFSSTWLYGIFCDASFLHNPPNKGAFSEEKYNRLIFCGLFFSRDFTASNPQTANSCFCLFFIFMRYLIR